MSVELGHTLTLDGQQQGDTYSVTTTGSQGLNRNYVINVLDTGTSGTDVLTVLGTDSSNDVFLLRKFASLVETGWTPVNPAFVALLHDDITDARTRDPLGQESVRPQAVQRINYDSGIDDAGGGLFVRGLGGADTFATDDNSALTELDGGDGNDTFLIGQLYGSPRTVAAASLVAADVFATTTTTRGWLSNGNSRDLRAVGGTGNDDFVVYANRALATLLGGDGNDRFTLRSFALANTTAACDTDASSAGCVVSAALVGGLPQYAPNALVVIDGGAGTDLTVIVATELADHFVIDGLKVYGAGRSTSLAGVELLDVDGLEGDDTFDVLATDAGLLTTVIAGLGSDVVNVTGDVFAADLALAIGDTTTFPKRMHLVGALDGALGVEGGDSGADRSLLAALLLPGEDNRDHLAITPVPPENEQIDVLNVFDDSATTGGTFTLIDAKLTPSEAPAGIAWGSFRIVGDTRSTHAVNTNVEVVNLLLGAGADQVTIDGTGQAGPDFGTATIADHGGLTLVHGGGGNDTITVLRGGGPGSPLVVYGDTSQDGAWYAGNPGDVAFGQFGAKPFANQLGNTGTFRFPLASPFTTSGADTIDARATGVLGITAYGGPGNDTSCGSQAGDFLAGGSGDDTISGRRRIDQIYGDSGVNVDIRTRTLTIPTTNGSIAPNADAMVAGRDSLFGEGAASANGATAAFADVIFGTTAPSPRTRWKRLSAPMATTARPRSSEDPDHPRHPRPRPARPATGPPTRSTATQAPIACSVGMAPTPSTATTARRRARRQRPHHLCRARLDRRKPAVDHDHRSDDRGRRRDQRQRRQRHPVGRHRR